MKKPYLQNARPALLMYFVSNAPLSLIALRSFSVLSRDEIRGVVLPKSGASYVDDVLFMSDSKCVFLKSVLRWYYAM